MSWVKKQVGIKLDRATIISHNAFIDGYIHDDATRKGILAANDLADDAVAPPDAVSLNNLDDWKELHETELKVAPVVQEAVTPPPADAPLQQTADAL